VRSALVVGTNEYRDSRLRGLRAPAHEAEALAAVLGDPSLGDFEVDVLTDPEERTLRRRVSAFFRERSRDDLLLLHFSCHGVKDEHGDLHFAAVDTDLDDLEATAISAEFVNTVMARSGSRRIVLLLDCCYSGAFGRSALARGGNTVDLKERFDGRGRIVLTASTSMEYAFEGGDVVRGARQRPSVFSSAVVEGIRSGDADLDGDGEITVDELYDYVYEAVRKQTPSQTPSKWSFDAQGELRIAKSVVRPERARPPAAASTAAAPASPVTQRLRLGVPAGPAARVAWAGALLLLAITLTSSNGLLFADPGHEPYAAAYAMTTSFLVGLVCSIVLVGVESERFVRRLVLSLCALAGVFVAVESTGVLVDQHSSYASITGTALISDWIPVVTLVAGALLALGSALALRSTSRSPRDSSSMLAGRDRVAVAALAAVAGILYFVSLWVPVGHTSFFTFGTDAAALGHYSWRVFVATTLVAAAMIVVSLWIARGAPLDLLTGVLVGLTVPVVADTLLALRVHPSSYTLSTLATLITAVCLIAASVVSLRAARRAVGQPRVAAPVAT